MIVQVSHFVRNGSPTPFVAFVGDRSVGRVVIVETSYPQTHILKSGWGHTGLRFNPERRSEGCDEKCCRQAAEHETSDRKHSRPFHHFACRRTFQLLRCCCRLYGVSSGLPVVSGRVHVWQAVTCRGGHGLCNSNAEMPLEFCVVQFLSFFSFHIRARALFQWPR